MIGISSTDGMKKLLRRWLDALVRYVNRPTAMSEKEISEIEKAIKEVAL